MATGEHILDNRSRTVVDYLRRSLPDYKVPDRFLAWPDTDRESFKIDRARFRRLALEAQAGTRPDRRGA